MDCNKKNNFLYNLEYVTALENVRHSIANGLINRPTINITGENNPSSKLTNKKVIKIRKLFKIGNITQIELGKLFNVHNTTISGIIRRVYWKHV